MAKLKPTTEELMNREVRASLLAGQERKALNDQSVAKYISTCKEQLKKLRR